MPATAPQPRHRQAHGRAVDWGRALDATAGRSVNHIASNEPGKELADDGKRLARHLRAVPARDLVNERDHVAAADFVYSATAPSGQHEAAQNILSLLVRSRARSRLCIEFQELLSEACDGVRLSQRRQVRRGRLRLLFLCGWIDALLDLASGVHRCLASRCQRERASGRRSKGQLPRHAVEAVTQRPGLHAARLHDEIETRASWVGIFGAHCSASRGALRLCGLDGELGEDLRHRPLPRVFIGVTKSRRTGCLGVSWHVI